MTTNRITNDVFAADRFSEQNTSFHLFEKEAPQGRGRKEADEIAKSRYLATRFAHLDGAELSLGELAEEFSASFEQLRRYFKEIDEFARQICAVGIQTTSEHPDLEKKVHAAKLESLCSLLKEKFPPRSPLRMDLIEEVFRDAKDAGRSRQEAIKGLQKTLEGELYKVAEDVAGYVFAMLDNLINKELVGLIDWRSEDLCTFSFFTNEATSYVTSVTRTKETRVEREERIQKTVSQESETTKGKTVHRHVRHDHELVDAKRHALPGPTSVVIPERIGQFMASIPAWLKPMCHLVDGKQILERRIAIDVGTEDWEEVKKHEPVVEQVVQLDPAITLADVYVLAGWGQADMDAELARQEREASKRRAKEEKRRQEVERKRKQAAKARAEARKDEIIRGAKQIGIAALITLVVGGILYLPFYKLMVYLFSQWMT